MKKSVSWSKNLENVITYNQIQIEDIHLEEYYDKKELTLLKKKSLPSSIIKAFKKIIIKEKEGTLSDSLSDKLFKT